jgi:hypothetical protein
MTQVSYYVGLDVHRKTIWYCMKTAAGEIVREGPIEARREALAAWAKTIEEPWCGGLEATLGSHWISSPRNCVHPCGRRTRPRLASTVDLLNGPRG